MIDDECVRVQAALELKDFLHDKLARLILVMLAERSRSETCFWVNFSSATGFNCVRVVHSQTPRQVRHENRNFENAKHNGERTQRLHSILTTSSCSLDHKVMKILFMRQFVIAIPRVCCPLSESGTKLNTKSRTN